MAHLDEIDEISNGRCPWRPVRHPLRHHLLRRRRVDGPRCGQPDHQRARRVRGEDLQEELYLVQRGRATFELDGERVDSPAGTLIFARPAVKRTAFAEEAGTTVVALGGTPGKVYEPGGWEIWAPLQRLYEAGEFAEAADRGSALIDAHPEYPNVLCNVVCCESLAGGLRMRSSTSGSRSTGERFRSLAAGDSDFDPIRDEAAFEELVGKRRSRA